MSTTNTAPMAKPPPPGTMAATPFAPPYKSIFTLQEPIKPLLENMPHVNCSYLSTPGIAPTLLQLKQHAQSLCILIKYLTINTMPGLINNAESEIEGPPTFSDGESYDFLNDLSQAYTGPENPALTRHHNMPLTALLNVLEQDSHYHGGMNTRAGRRGYYAHHDNEEMSVHDICPLRTAHPSLIAENQPSMPYATHQALIAHANEVLELLDHEYSAKGGLLSILPSKDHTEDREKAETTLLGQLILYMQRLVQRVHDLERQYANAMDALAGEAAVPHQALSRLGPDGRTPREMVYPQDRFVLVNAGEDVWNFLHKEFEKKEVVDEKVAEMYLRQGVAGEALWQQRGGKEMSRGITAVDIATRYYRLRKDPLKTIFVIPAHTEHPNTKATIEMEKQPSVVSVVKPVWPERASMWEMKHRAELEELKKLRQDHMMVAQDLKVKETAERLLSADNKVKDGTISNLMAELQQVKAYLDLPENERQKNLLSATAKVNADRLAAETAQAALTKAQADQDKLNQALSDQRAALEAERQQLKLDGIAQKKAIEQELLAWRADKNVQDKMIGENARQLHQQLELAWRERMRETEVLVSVLRKRGEPIMASMVPDPQVVQAGWAEADAVVDGILGTNSPPQPQPGFQELEDSDSSMEY